MLQALLYLMELYMEGDNEEISQVSTLNCVRR